MHKYSHIHTYVHKHLVEADESHIYIHTCTYTNLSDIEQAGSLALVGELNYAISLWRDHPRLPRIL